MNLEQLAETLGLPKDSPQEAIFGAVAKRDAEGRAAVASLETLTSQLSGVGVRLEKGVLSRVEPLKLDLSPKEGDDPEKAELRKRLFEAEQKAIASELTSNKTFVTKLSADLKLPPAAAAVLEECLAVRGELETMMLAKDAKGVESIELRRTKDLPGKLRGLFNQLLSFKGVKFATPTEEPKTDSEAAKSERERLAKELLSRQQPEEAAATK